MSERLIPGGTGTKADVVRYLLGLPIAVRAYIERLGTRSPSDEVSDVLVEARPEVLPAGRTEATARELFEQLQQLPDEGTEESPNVEVIELARRLVTQAEETLGDKACAAGELQTAIDELPRDQRLVLGMHVTDDMNFRQIAQKLQIPAEVVLKLLAIAYSTLRLRLRDADNVSAGHFVSGE